jgi:hypothetical protein
MFWELFIVGSIWFWFLSAILGSFFLYNIFHEKTLGATSSLIIYGLVICFFGNFNVFSWVWDNPWELLKWGGSYVILGVLWSILRWYLFNTKVKYAFNEIKTAFKKEHNITGDVPNELRGEWRRYLNGRHDEWDSVARHYEWTAPVTIRSLEDIIPAPRKYRRSIICWMTFWPLSVIFFLLHDFITGLFERLYQALSNVYGMITKSVFGKITDDLKEV